MKRLWEWFSDLDNYVWILFFAVIFLLFLLPKIWEAGRNFLLFFRVTKLGRREKVLDFLSRLAKLPEDVVDLVLSQIFLPVDTSLFIEQLVRQYTQILTLPTSVGIHDVPSGKVVTKFYVDILSACCNSKIRLKLALMVALRLNEVIRRENYTFDAIAVSARGNVLLASKVAELLDKPVVLFGDLAGVTFPQRISAMHQTSQRYIIIDGISATGEETLFVARLIKDLGAEVRFVFVALERCFGAKDRVRRDSPFKHPLELVYLDEYDDKRCTSLLSK